jgi:hypothetical protein
LNKKSVMFTSFCFWIAIFGLFGCENDRNTDVICKNNPELCVDLHRDSWCLYEKASLIRHRYALKQTEVHTGKQLYQQLIMLENYSKCIELAAGVQHIIHTERTLDRKRAFAVSTQNLAQLQEFTKDNQDIYLAFYRWMRFGEQAAFMLVNNAFKQGEIQEVEILQQLAVHYLKIDANISKDIYRQMFAAITSEDLIHSDDNEISMDLTHEFNPDWLLGLANVHQQQQNFAKVYLLTKVNLAITQKNASDEQLLALINSDKKLAIKFDAEAKAIAQAIINGHITKRQLDALFG